jgi:hypothetical protein
MMIFVAGDVVRCCYYISVFSLSVGDASTVYVAFTEVPV